MMTMTDEPETSVIDSDTRQAAALAWSDDDEPDQPQRHSWRVTWWYVTLIAGYSAVLALGVGAVLWANTFHPHQPVDDSPLPTTPPAVEPLTPWSAAPPPVAPTSTVTQTVTPADRDARFVAQVHANLPAVFYDGPVESAQNLCREIATGDGTKRSDIAVWVTLPDVTVEKATFWWNLATSTYCPQYQ
jgi:hypothetical protein